MSTASKNPTYVAVVALPFPAQGHLNQMLQFCSLISTHGLPVHYVSSAVHIRQARARVNSLSPQSIAGINFHDISIPPFLCPPPNPNSGATRFPSHLQPAVDAMQNLRGPVSDLLKKLAGEFRRIVVVYDVSLTASNICQDVAEIHNAEAYELVCVSAFSTISFICGFTKQPFPLPHPKELPAFEDWMPDSVTDFALKKYDHLDLKSGSIFNTSRLIEAPYMEVLDKCVGKPCWAVGPMLPALSPNPNRDRHECLEWLDKQEPRSVIYVSFGTTVSLSDEQINELAHGLQGSKVKFLWVLRDADRGDVFEGEVRRAEPPEGFEERVREEGIVVREWVQQPQILAHSSVGGFISHCGWNSCVESITAGVAMAAWPMHSDQPSNAALVADVLRTGVVVREWKERAEVVKASRVESVVRRLMASEEGKEMRKRAEELGAAVRGATEPGGASRVELESFIAHITRVDPHTSGMKDKIKNKGIASLFQPAS